MIVIPVKTKKITIDDKLEDIVQNYLRVEEGDVVIFTSKIISFFERQLIKKTPEIDKTELAKKNSDRYIEAQNNILLTIKNGHLVANAGIDESNADENFILYPQKPFESAKNIYSLIQTTFNIKNFGVIISDSAVFPLRKGTLGFAVSWHGLEPLKSYIGKPDLDGRMMKFSSSNIVDGLCAAAVVEMGEGDECTPICVIKNKKGIVFNQTEYSEKDIQINPEEDLFAPIFNYEKMQKN